MPESTSASPDQPLLAPTPSKALHPTKVYDARGTALSCTPPQASCPPVAPDLAFSDRCALGGYRIVQCGCSSLCTGDVSRDPKRYYDASGQMKPCEPAVPDCDPPPASAAFQDACIGGGRHLQVCGCEWLCTGNFTK
ncbi:hypothetical protein [Chondromyces apiculatus]|uniref:Uncharacterized protein n=1 Tax=Chondromyces apiculatus DSM 436 TaxID=1192034 RepID=A0A017T0Q9_9BACT|nr:hypothetical protein [Chondromyces apiculatus]EYF02849.1 Hypothetical protein CAP_6429 [Chondromyces apiculatus DSM 436]